MKRLSFCCPQSPPQHNAVSEEPAQKGLSLFQSFWVHSSLHQFIAEKKLSKVNCWSMMSFLNAGISGYSTLQWTFRNISKPSSHPIWHPIWHLIRNLKVCLLTSDFCIVPPGLYFIFDMFPSMWQFLWVLCRTDCMLLTIFLDRSRESMAIAS